MTSDPMTTSDIWRAIARYGLPTALLVPLLYFIVVEVRADQKAFRQQHQDMVTEQQHLARGLLKVADRVGEQHMLAEKVLWVLRTMCVQDAKTAGDRGDCLRER